MALRKEADSPWHLGRKLTHHSIMEGNTNHGIWEGSRLTISFKKKADSPWHLGSRFTMAIGKEADSPWQLGRKLTHHVRWKGS